MKVRFAGFALLLSVVLLGAFISGCINQSVNTETTSKPTETVTKTETKTETETPPPTETQTKTTPPTETQPREEKDTQIDVKLKELEEAVGLIDSVLGSGENQVMEAFSNVTLVRAPPEGSIVRAQPENTRIKRWIVRAQPEEEKFHRLMRLAENEDNKTKKFEYLSDAYLIRLAQLVSLRNALITAAVERAYWDRIEKGEPVDEFYSENGIFLVGGKHVSAREMAQNTLKAVEGKEIVSIEIYHPASGLRFADTRDPSQGWKIAPQNPIRIVIPPGKVVKFKAGSDLAKAVNMALPQGNVVLKEARRGSFISEIPYGDPQSVKLGPGVYAIDGVGCIGANLPHDEILTSGNVITITPYNPFLPCSYPVNGTLLVVGNYSEARELSPEEFAKIQREIPEAKDYSKAIGISAGEYKVTTMGFGLAMVDAETGEIIGEAALQGNDIGEDITVNPVSRDFFLAVMGGTPEVAKVGCWLVEEDENGDVVLNIKEKCNSPVLLRISPESSIDAPKVDHIPLEEVDTFVGEGNMSVIRITINEEYMGKRDVKRIRVDIEGLKESAGVPVNHMKLKNVIDPESATTVFIKIDGIDGESNSTAWGFPLTVNETAAYPGPYSPFLARILSPFHMENSFTGETIKGNDTAKLPVPSAVRERISRPDYGMSDESQIPFVIITGGDGAENGIPEYTIEIPYVMQSEIPLDIDDRIGGYRGHTLDEFIIEVLTLRDPATGEESVVAFLKLIGADGKFSFRSEIARVESIVVLEAPSITINEEEKHK
ncbi:HU family DNA-binding protein [Thermococcus litoralis]|uniref:hypothetical protein n=1 Tax=Thermococcus litoralis TaxID=2265 RepID=UPI000B35925E|nr:hypothetical protein [Thermococcus litoralis]